MVTAGNVQRKPSSTFSFWAMNHCVSTFRGLFKKELHSINSIKFSCYVKRLATFCINIVDSLFVSTENYLQCSAVVMRRGVVEGQGTNSIFVNQCLRVQYNNHIN